MSTFGPLQKFSLTWVASGAFTRTCTRPPSSTRGYSAPQTFVDAGRNSFGAAQQRLAHTARIIPNVILMDVPLLSSSKSVSQLSCDAANPSVAQLRENSQLVERSRHRQRELQVAA